ncbi:hypothetical protein GCM10007416_05510 [Kroppenstedtia guangzhouensis]|uniref:YkoP-like domain-containing protein n=1 Tax=Kroppenstedtia guangzhouensis TaxID=1274356 RepID=A0ABQ1G2G8_9BACL|nr:hypothetical protein [Kroppenstedtia guangzhouensis]GGA35564.1 hypothetical protein GCM10007416_05510 [Kroppenstedtia guangzhouensis]
MITGAFLAVWQWVDKLYYWVTRLQYVDRNHHNLFRVVVKPYRGETLITRDGVRLKKGDWYAKLHLHNFRIAQLLTQTSRRKGRRAEIGIELMILRQIRSSFPALAEFLERHPHSNRIQVLLGTTFLHSGSEYLGFDAREIPGIIRMQLKAFFLKLILVSCHPQGWKRLRNYKHPLIPKRVFISREEFNRRYSPARLK